MTNDKFSFLSPDNYVQDPTSQQGFNRYAYCFYNPLRYTDPTGERVCGNENAEIRFYNDLLCQMQRKMDLAVETMFAIMDMLMMNAMGWGDKMPASGGGNEGGGGNGGRQTPLEPGSYVVDSNGNISIVTNESYMHDDGNVYFYNEDYSKSISVDYGVISSKIIEEQLYWSSATEDWKHTNEVTYFSMKGDIEALGVLKFMADNTDVEWSLTFVGDYDESILSTSHMENRELYQGFLMSKDWTIRGHCHSHPYHDYPSLSDKKWAGDVHSKFPCAVLFIMYNGIRIYYDENWKP